MQILQYFDRFLVNSREAVERAVFSETVLTVFVSSFRAVIDIAIPAHVDEIGDGCFCSSSLSCITFKEGFSGAWEVKRSQIART